jgi:hypothetical protein
MQKRLGGLGVGYGYQALRGVLPKCRANRSAVSAVMPLFSFKICVIRPEGTRNANASLLVDKLRVCSFLLRILPAWLVLIITPYN